MTKTLSLKQLLFAYILTMLAPIFRSMPNSTAKDAGQAAWVSVIIGCVLGLITCVCLWLFIKAFPAYNFYEISAKITTKPIAKIIIFLYLLWAVLNVSCKLEFYSLNYKTTLMTYSTSEFMFFVMLLIVAYALFKGAKTFFRLSELVLIAFLVVVTLLILVSLFEFNPSNLVPNSSVKNILKATPNSFSVVGHIFVLIFFADRLERHYTKFKPYLAALGVVSAVCIAITAATIGTNGSMLTSSLTFPFYTLVKRIRFLDVFERVEEFVILPSVLSDFVFICLFSCLIFLCLKWLFNIQNIKVFGIPVFLSIYFFALMLIKTQFEAENFYRYILTYANIVFLYIIPLILLITAALRGQLKNPTGNFSP